MSRPTTIPQRVAANRRLGSWLEIDPSGGVTAYTGKVEFGQGILTAIAQLVADELDVSVGRVIVRPVDTDRSPDEGVTSGSLSIEESNEHLRRAAAETRQALLERAAERLGVAATSLSMADGEVHAPDGTVIGIGDLADAELREAEFTGTATVKSAAQHRAIGTSLPRVDLPAKLTGSPAFIQDLELPEMLHGRVLRPPAYDARLVALDVDAVRSLDGIQAVIHDGSFVGVVADREEQAIRALKRARRLARWQPAVHLPDSSRFLLDAPSVDSVVERRVDEAARAQCASTMRAEYSRPYLAHASLGPSCAIATFDAGRYEVMSHTQGAYNLRQELAKVLGVDESSVRVLHAEGAGCYGANGADDAALDAALLARAVPGRPVRLQWMRDDEFAWEPYGTAMFVRLAAELNAAGDVVHWQHEVWGNGHRNRLRPGAPRNVTNLLAAGDLAEPFVRSVSGPPTSGATGGNRNAAPPYGFPDLAVINHHVARAPLRVSALRSLGAHLNVFAAESFMDEIAAASGRDPLQHRLSHLDDPRARYVLEAVAADAGWERRERAEEGHGFGIAFARYKTTSAYVAVIAEIVIGAGIELAHVWAAVDAGMAVNPDGVRNQAEGGIFQAASWTLCEEVMFDRGRITSRGWDTYPILGFRDTPEISVNLISRPDEAPHGVGEAFAGPTAAAIGNAIYDATGVRLRDMPLSPARLARGLV